jgi:hypothetical protein
VDGGWSRRGEAPEDREKPTTGGRRWGEEPHSRRKKIPLPKVRKKPRTRRGGGEEEARRR